ncbi:MAG TPA: SH3 domain-containing protein [Pyrinomonadaceae bacterium]|jgi:hypothetical protein
MFLRFTKKFSRPVRGFIIALLMLVAPALIAVTVESAPQKNKARTAPTPKKASSDKKAQAKSKPTPKPTPAKSKTNAKNTKEAASRNKKEAASRNKTAAKRSDQRNEKNSASKNERKTADKNKNSKTADKRNSKQTLASNNKIPSKTSKSDRNAKNERSSKNNDRSARTPDKNKNSSVTRQSNADKNRTKPVVAKTATTRRTPKSRTTETKSITTDSNKNTDQTVDKTPEKTIETTTAELPEIIVAAYSVPVRSQASATAPLLSNVRLGSVLRVAEKKPEWYKVQYWADGKNTSGWIPASAVSDLNASGRSEVYRQIVDKNYKPQMDFETATEFYEFTSKVGGELDGSEKSGEIELKRLLALRSALKTVPADQRETAPYSDFLKAQEKAIVYNEPAGQWLVVSNEFWDLHNKYKKLPVADTIAWEAANNPLPGECEGYVNCYLFDMRMRFGEYLNLHPNGKNSAEALKNMTDYLAPIVSDAPSKTVYNGPTDVTDRAEFNNLIAELRTIVARLPFVEKEKTLQQLRAIAEAYR